MKIKYTHQEVLDELMATAKTVDKRSYILDDIVKHKELYKYLINFHNGSTYPISWMLIETGLDYYLKELLPIVDFKVTVYKEGKNEFKYVDFFSETIKKEQTNAFKLILEYLEESKKPYEDWCGVDVGFLTSRGNRLISKSVLHELLRRPPVLCNRLLNIIPIDLNYSDSYDFLGLIGYGTTNFSVNININTLYKKMDIIENISDLPNNLLKMVYVLGSEDKWQSFYGNQDKSLLPYLISRIENAKLYEDINHSSKGKSNNFKV